MKTLKIVVVGPYQAGKSVFIQTARGISSSEHAAAQNNDPEVKQISSVATDFEKIMLDEDMMIYLFGIPAQQRFDFMWDLLEDKIHGFVVLLDNTKPETFQETRKILDLISSKTGAPYVVSGTSTDALQAWQPEDIRRSLRLSQQLKYLSCDVNEISSVKKIILELLYEILSKYEG